MKLKTLSITLFLMTYSMHTLSGLSQSAPVVIDVENQTAGGDMVTARFSENEYEAIGCGVRKFFFSDEEGGLLSYGFCQARISEEEEGYVICTTQNKDLLDGINSISDNSYVTFSWDENNECTRIGNSTQSFYIPNYKLKKEKKK